MPTQYSRSADTLCLSIRALRLSGEEAPGSFWVCSVSWDYQAKSCGLELCTGENWASGAGMSDLPPQLPVHHAPGSPPCFRHTWRNSACYLHCGSEFSVASTQQSWNLSVWLTHSSNFAPVTLCSTWEGERME